MRREAMADRLVNYGDATAALAVVNSLAFLIAMTEGEVRCSLAERASLVYGGLFAFAIVFTAVVIGCHRVEGRIRAHGEPLEDDLEALRRGFVVARVAVIWLSNVGSLPAVMLALRDSACLAA